MRASFIKSLIEAAKSNDRIYLLVGDIGYNLVEPFRDAFPERFVNVGIAEQNMVGIAAGLALSGKTVFLYSIANFPTVRCVEQIRNDVCYHNADVTIVSAGGGLIYGALGMTHHLTDDVAHMRALPNMTVIAPADPVEAAQATRTIAATPGPCYLRLGRTGDPRVHEDPVNFEIGRAIQLRDGGDVTLIGSGGIMPVVQEAAAVLASSGTAARVLSMPTIKPLDDSAVIEAARETGAVVTIEEHGIIGGLGSAVAELLAEQVPGTAFIRLGLPDRFSPEVGSQDYLRNVHGLTAPGIIAAVKKLQDTKKR